MRKNYDEPQYIDVNQENNRAEAIERIKSLCTEQSFAVLATQGNQECYTSLISFAASSDYRQIAFATPVNTKKLDLIKGNQQVSVLIDNRSNNPASINDIVAVTARGQARVLAETAEIANWSEALVAKHGYLANFIQAPTTAIVLIDVASYYVVRRFQAVMEWMPDEVSAT